MENMSKDEEERYKAELRKKYIMDQKATEAAGYDKGLEAGIEQGIQQNRIEIVKEMKKLNIDIETIIKVSKLSREEIEKISI